MVRHGGSRLSLIAANIFVPIGAVRAGDARGTGRFFLRLAVAVLSTALLIHWK